MTPDELFEDFERGFAHRKYIAGLLVAFIDFLSQLDAPSRQFSSYERFLEAFPRVTTTGGGKSANTLIVRKPDGKTLSIRPSYNAAERYYRAENKRFDYPNCAPHATQSWSDYTAWLNALVTFDDDQLAALKVRVNQFVLDTLTSQAFDPTTIKLEPPLFRIFLESFALTAHKGEPSGAAFQGIVFGFFRADNPHLQFEIDKVRTGSKRLQRVGDVDGWEGGRLALSAEVKQYMLKSGDVQLLTAFANATGERGALGVIAALDFEAGVRDVLKDMGVIPLSRSEMIHIVELWDPIKQRIAVSSFLYYSSHVEKNSVLNERAEAFLLNARQEWDATRRGDGEADLETS